MSHNQFVDYLNSMNNASGNTAAALAEAQVLSDYYDKIRVERQLGRYISNIIKEGKKLTIVLTGHAGDGKTSILVQVLRDLRMLPINTPIAEEKLYTNDDIKLYAVKDMSELPEKKQVEFCRKALDAPLNGYSSIVISNTGPLLRCIESIRQEQCTNEGIPFDESERSELQTRILNQLDLNSDQPVELGEYKFLMINIARIDNLSFAQEVLEKILVDELWQPCRSCEKREKCHIRFNVKQLGDNYGRVVSFINAFYRYLYDNDMRMTIRQMLSQIGFSITGNESCSDIKAHDKDRLKFDYLFSNLFFGYRGLDEIKNADQIQGIDYARELHLDTIALSADYSLFVAGDFSRFPFDIRSLIEQQYKYFSKKHINIDNEDEQLAVLDLEYRKAVRRAYIFYEQIEMDNSTYNPLYDELFGDGFNNYLKLQDGTANHKVRIEMEKTILDALYLEMTGTLSKQIDEIPLTIKRNDDSFQSVMVTTGKLKKQDLKVTTVSQENPFEDNGNKKKVILRICGKEDFNLSLPMVIYFFEIARGAISTIADPALTHGISKLKTILNKWGSADDDGEISLIVNNTDKPVSVKLFIEDQLYISR